MPEWHRPGVKKITFHIYKKIWFGYLFTDEFWSSIVENISKLCGFQKCQNSAIVTISYPAVVKVGKVLNLIKKGQISKLALFWDFSTLPYIWYEAAHFKLAGYVRGFYLECKSHSCETLLTGRRKRLYTAFNLWNTWEDFGDTTYEEKGWLLAFLFLKEWGFSKVKELHKINIFVFWLIWNVKNSHKMIM